MSLLILHEMRWCTELVDGKYVYDEDGDLVRHPERGREVIVNVSHIVTVTPSDIGAQLLMASDGDWMIEVFESFDDIKTQLGLVSA